MRMIDLIEKKRDGEALSEAEIQFFIQGVTQKKIPDYQIASLLMAIVLRGMTDDETADLTIAMANSGDVLDLSAIPGVKVDKHSTGGVGDKCTPILLPLLASFGVPVVKLSGRALGFTGGTIDKFESIEGFQCEIAPEAFPKHIEKCGMLLAGQSEKIAPADKALYALRDVTGTVPSIPLIASSIMSKKLSGGADAIVLDVTCGKGAFMKTLDDARKLAQMNMSIGKLCCRPVSCVISSMEQPLGHRVGNVLEMLEVMDVLHGHGQEDIVNVVSTLAAEMLLHTPYGEGKISKALEGEAIAKLRTGEVNDKFIELILSQGGKIDSNGMPIFVERPCEIMKVMATKSGYISRCDALGVGEASVLLGAGRMKKTDAIDFGAGVEVHRKIGDYVNRGDVLYSLYKGSKATVDEDILSAALDKMENVFEICDEKTERPIEILDILR